MRRNVCKSLALGLMIFCLSPASQSAERMNVELILDASGSMMGKLADGTTKFSAARSAVEELLTQIDESVVLAFRAYGHQYPREAHNCNDTELLVPFGGSFDEIGSAMVTLRAQGYTPISRVLKQAAADVSETEGIHMIVLVSDGKETCEGDPCETARALKASDAGVMVHTIGFGVDDATRAQLQCIAENTGGQYFDAGDRQALIQVLNQALRTDEQPVSSATGIGYLKMIGPDLRGHDVYRAATEESVGSLSRVQPFLEVESGIYSIDMGEVLWKSVQVEPGDTTVLQPCHITVNSASLRGHDILDAETGREVADVSLSDDTATVLPGDYIVTFGKNDVLSWAVSVDSGQTVVLNPGTVAASGAGISGYDIFQSGEEVGTISSTSSWMPLPPGRYQIEIDDEIQTFEVSEGQDIRFDR